MCYFFRAARPAVRAVLVFGTNCLPLAVPSRFFFVVAAYSFDDKLSIAFFGRYRSPVALGPCVDGFPDLVVHFSDVHLVKDFCLEVLAPVYPPPAALYFWATNWALRADHCPALPPWVPAITWFLIRFRNDGLV